MSEAGKERPDYPRKSVMMYMVGNFPFGFVLGVDGSSDLAILHPSMAISTYAEPVFVVTSFMDRPLQGTRE